MGTGCWVDVGTRSWQQHKRRVASEAEAQAEAAGKPIWVPVPDDSILQGPALFNKSFFLLDGAA